MFVPEWNKLAHKVWVKQTREFLEELDSVVYRKFHLKVPCEIDMERKTLNNKFKTNITRKDMHELCCEIVDLIDRIG